MYLLVSELNNAKMTVRNFNNSVLSGWILHDMLLHRLRSWSWHFFNSDISQGSVVTQLRCREIISQGFVANLLMNLPVKEVWKSVNIWRSYGQYCSALFLFLTHSVYAMYAVTVVTLGSPMPSQLNSTQLNSTQRALTDAGVNTSLSISI